MTLGELIDFLKKYPPAQKVEKGFGNPHSYRGFYDELAFEVVKNTTVGEMLNEAQSAVGEVFMGYKGGEYTMHKHTECHLANYGCCGEGLGSILLAFMLGEPTATKEQDDE